MSTANGNPADIIDDHPRRPKDTPFRQQKVKTWLPVLVPAFVIPFFLLIGVIFLPVGFWLRKESNSVKETAIRYDGSDSAAGLEDCAVTGFGQISNCSISFVIQENMSPPIYVYYQLSEFFQNHRRYVKSRSSPQLLGTQISPDNNCDPLQKSATTNVDLNPCGLIANSLFTDIFTVTAAPAPFDGVNSDSFMSETDIAWDVDRETRFKQPDGFAKVECPAGVCETCLPGLAYTTANPCKLTMYKGVQWAYWYPSDDTIQYLYETYPTIISPIEGVTNEHFMVWMRTAATPTFRKLYGIISTPLVAGDIITFAITASYYVTGFDGTKSVVLGTVSTAGGRNKFIGPAYIALGSLAVAVGISFLIKHFTKPRSLGDPRFMRQPNHRS